MNPEAFGCAPLPPVLKSRTTQSGRLYGRSLATNIGFNVLHFAVISAIGVWYTPFLVHQLGPAVYGLIPLTTQVLEYLRVATLGLNAGVGRYLTIALTGMDFEKANETFNTSVFGTLVIALCLIPVGVLVTLNVERIFNLPAGFENDSAWLIGCSVVSFVILAISAPFDISSYCCNRFDVRNVILISSASMRVGLAVFLFIVIDPRLRYVGLAMIAAALFYFGASCVAWRRLTPELRLDFRFVRLATLQNLISFGFWSVVNHLGTVLFLSVDLLVVNLLFGPESTGYYGAALQWSLMLRAMAGAIAGVFGPTILRIFAENDLDRLLEYSRRAVRLVGTTIALPVGLISGLSEPLVHLWLGPEFIHIAPLLSLLTFHLCVNLAFLPLHGVSTAANKVFVPGIVSLIMGAGNLGLALLLGHSMGLGSYGVALAGAISLTAKNVVFTPIYSAHILRVPAVTFLRELPPVIVTSFSVAGASWLTATYVDLTSWGRLATVLAVATAMYCTIAFYFLIGAEQRASMRARFSLLFSAS